jgi:hypothetical protein
MLNTSANHRLVRASQQRHGAYPQRVINPLVVRITHGVQTPAQAFPRKRSLSRKAHHTEAVQIPRPQCGSELVNLYCPNCGQVFILRVNSQSALLGFYLGTAGLVAVTAFTCYLLFNLLDLCLGVGLFTLGAIALLETLSPVNHHSVVSFEIPEDRAHHTLWHSAKI